MIPAPVIAIDGPSASGKGTVAARVATALGFHYLDSGALYRLTALAAERAGVAVDREDALAALAGSLDVVFDEAGVTLDGVSVTDAIRTEACGNAASRVAALPAVRAALLDRQRAFRVPPGLVADGRDMASVVFPDATLKVFLTASAGCRAQRRLKQLKDKGIDANIDDLVRDIEERDSRDAGRAVAPLQISPGAGILDTTPLGIQQVVDEILRRFNAVPQQA